MQLFWTFYSSKQHEKSITVSTKNIKQYLEWFLKDHVTLKTELKAAENVTVFTEANKKK